MKPTEYHTTKSLAIVSLVLIVNLYGNAQDLVLQLGAEKTVSGNQFDASAGVELKKLFALGGFYQSDLKKQSTEGSSAAGYTFYGLFMQLPIVKCERIAFFANIRAGLAEHRFLVMVPALETRYEITPRYGVGFGSSIRMGYPSLYGRLFIKPF